jgi:hypothetical protein
VRRAAVALVIALAVAPGALAHDIGRPHGGYQATFSNVSPPILGLQVAVLGGDQQLRMVNLSDKTIVILGPDGKPFLRFESTAVYRYEPVAGRWYQVASGNAYAWAEPRIAWSEPSPPEVVSAASNDAHFIRDWSIPGRADGKPFEIRGFLGWAPHGAGGPPGAAEAGDGRVFFIAFGLTAVAILAGAALYFARRRTSSSSRSA